MKEASHKTYASRFTYYLDSVETPREVAWTTTDIPPYGAMYGSYPVFKFVPGSQDEVEPIRYGDFILDLDSKDDVVRSVQDARRIVEHFEMAYGIAPEIWRPFLSGSKGVHLALPAEVLDIDGGHPLLPRIYKRLALELAGDTGVKTIDLSLYCMATGRPFRLPNRQRDNGLYKVPVTVDEFSEITDLEDYKQLCLAPREESARSAPEKNEALALKVQAYIAEAEKAASKEMAPLDDEAFLKLRASVPACIRIISKASKMPNGEPTFNRVAMQLIGYTVTAGLSEADAIQLCDTAIRSYPSPNGTHYNERLRKFKASYRHMKANEKGFSCGGIKALGFPSFSCGSCSLIKEADAGIDGTTARRFKLIRAGDVEAKAPQWVVRDLLEKDALALVFGDPGCGKSFWALDLALCVATGTPHHGREVKHGPVIYIAGEGQNGIKRRLLAWSKARGVDHSKAPLYLSLIPTALTNEDAMASVIVAIDEIAVTAPAPALVVIDTVARNFGPADENSTSDMSRFIAAADAIRARYQLTVLLIHHSGHGDKTRARGAMALKGALDVEYRMDKDETGTIRLEATKMKEAEHPEPMAFRLRSVDLDLADPDTGEVITSAALELTSYEPRAVRGKQGRGKHQTRALEVLRELWDARQDNGDEVCRISLDDWKGALKKDGSIPRKKIGEVAVSLCASGAVVKQHGFVSPVM